jgi:hypothetical protein
MRLYSDEQCLIEQGRVVPFPRALNLRAAALRLLVDDNIGEDDPLGERLSKRPAGDWNGIDYHELLPGWSPPPPQPLRALFLLGAAHSGPAAERVPYTAALRAALRWAKSCKRGLDRAAELAAVLQPVPCYRLKLDSPDAMARIIYATIASGAGL